MASVRGTIVLVEDDVGLNQAVSRLLQAAGFDVARFRCASEALSSDALQGASCVVLDVHLPDMTGYDLIGQLAQRGLVAPVIVITAHDDAYSRRKAQALGVHAYLTKPFAGRALVDAIERAINEPAAQRSDS